MDPPTQSSTLAISPRFRLDATLPVKRTTAVMAAVMAAAGPAIHRGIHRGDVPSESPSTQTRDRPIVGARNVMKTRFAPSPSGHLHVGGARTALFNFAFARRHGGRFVLRIEDTDRKRSSDSASLGFLRDLAWLGIAWDEGPELADAVQTPDGAVSCGGGDAGPYFQSERIGIYDAYFARLLAQGKAYYAFDTPEELDAKRKAAMAEKRAYRYDRAALQLSPEDVKERLDAGTPAVLRLRVPDESVTIQDEVLGESTFPAGEIDDFVIRKADGFPTYHFAVVVDDELMGVTHVLRAQEHHGNTAKHMLIQSALGFRHPVYGHLPLICNPDGSKMSKRDKDRLLRTTVRDRGLTTPPDGTIDQPTFDAWLGDSSRQLDSGDTIRMAEALGVDLPEIDVDDFRRSGYLPQVVVNFLSLNGWSPGDDLEKFDLRFLCEHFDLTRVQKTPARFDRVKLLSFNADALRAMDPDAFVDALAAHGRSEHAEFMERLAPEQFRTLALASQERSRTLDEPFRGNRWIIMGDDEIDYVESKLVRKALAGGPPSGIDHLRALRAVFAEIAAWNVEELERSITTYVDANAPGQMGKVAQPIRVALTGGTVSPPIFDTLSIVGKDSTLRRIDRCLEWSSARAS